MGDASDHVQQIVASLKKQEAQLEEAKAYKGQKPSASMKPTRQQIEQEFARAIGSSPAKLLTKMISNVVQRHSKSRSKACGRMASFTPFTFPNRIRLALCLSRAWYQSPYVILGLRRNIVDVFSSSRPFANLSSWLASRVPLRTNMVTWLA